MSASGARKPRHRKIICLALLLVLLSVALAKRNWTAWLPQYLASRQLASRQFDDARWWLSLAQVIAGENPETEFVWARFWRMSSDLNKAKGHLDKARVLGLQADRIQYEEILMSAQSGHLKDTLPLLNGMMVTASHTPDVYEAYVLGMIKSRTSMRTAIDLLYSWSNEFPEDPYPHFLLAQLSLQLMDIEVASAELQRVLELDPEHAKGAHAMGDLLLETQDLVGALKMFEIAANSEETRLTALVKQAHCRRLMGQTSAARSLLEVVFQELPESSSGNLELAQIELSEGELENAIMRLESIISRDKKNHEARYVLGRALRAAGRAEDARTQFKLATESKAALVRSRYLVRKLVLDPNNVDLRSNIGCTILAHGDSQEAVDWLNSALIINPRHQQTLQALVQHYETQGSSAETFGPLAEEYRKRLNP